MNRFLDWLARGILCLTFLAFISFILYHFYLHPKGALVCSGIVGFFSLFVWACTRVQRY
jgi:hypothetical protein